MRGLLAMLGAVLLLDLMGGVVEAQEDESKVVKGQFACPLSMCSVHEPVVTHWYETSNIFIGPYAGNAVSREKNLTHIGRDSVVTWRNKGNGPDRWTPIVLYVWWPDGSGGLMIDREQQIVKRCGPPDAGMVSCRPEEKP